MTREEIYALATENDIEAILADGFEDAFIGFAERCGSGAVAVYDFANAVKVLMGRDGMGEEEAEEYLHFNVLGAYAGEQTPWFVTVKP
jgi:hypothetical protein